MSVRHLRGTVDPCDFLTFASAQAECAIQQYRVACTEKSQPLQRVVLEKKLIDECGALGFLRTSRGNIVGDKLAHNASARLKRKHILTILARTASNNSFDTLRKRCLFVPATPQCTLDSVFLRKFSVVMVNSEIAGIVKVSNRSHADYRR